jgi:hypothetical protein
MNGRKPFTEVRKVANGFRLEKSGIKTGSLKRLLNLQMLDLGEAHRPHRRSGAASGILGWRSDAFPSSSGSLAKQFHNFRNG